MAAAAVVFVTFQVGDPIGPGRTTTFLVGGLDPAHLYASMAALGTIAIACAVVLLSRISAVRGIRIALAVLSGAALIAGLTYAGGVGLLNNGFYTTLKGDTGGRDLVAWESDYSRYLFERHGTTLEVVGRLGADDIDAPFRLGEYRVATSGDRTTVSWATVHGGAIDAEIVVDSASAARARAGAIPTWQRV